MYSQDRRFVLPYSVRNVHKRMRFLLSAQRSKFTRKDDVLFCHSSLEMSKTGLRFVLPLRIRNMHNIYFSSSNSLNLDQSKIWVFLVKVKEVSSSVTMNLKERRKSLRHISLLVRSLSLLPLCS